jgi:outer membrane protein OmpA-like peptidoglycan-associated protein
MRSIFADRGWHGTANVERDREVRVRSATIARTRETRRFALATPQAAADHLRMRNVIAALLLTVSGCSLITVQQDPFPPLEVRAERPPPGPSRVVLTESSIKITDKVQFETGSSEILPVSFGLLDEVAAMLTDNPQIEQLQVEGHTDSTGSAGVNRKLSQQRAESVKKYLAGKGVAAARMVAKGFGPDRAIASNDTDEGKEQNRRVEFNILKQGPKKTVVTDD